MTRVTQGAGRSLGCKGNSTHLSVTIRFWCNDNPILSQKYCTVNHELALKIQIKKITTRSIQTANIRDTAVCRSGKSSFKDSFIRIVIQLTTKM